jgi:hypothetical protein
LLRESSKAKGEDYDLSLLVGGGGDGNIAHGRLLVDYADAVIGNDSAALALAQAQIRARMGDAALVDAAAIVATFNAIDRVADATGIPIEDAKAESSAELRKSLGIDTFAESKGEIADPRHRGGL